MIHEKHHDRIKVAAVFDGKQVNPFRIRWGRHLYQISRVLNVHAKHDGRERLFYFSVATETDFFRLEFHSETLEWYLVEHYQE